MGGADFADAIGAGFPGSRRARGRLASVGMFEKILVGYTDSERGRDARALGQALSQACGAELLVATAAAAEGEDLGALARAHGADLVVLGSTHRGPVGRVVPGATVERLLGEPPCAVAVAPPGFAERPLDGDVRQPLAGSDDTDPGLRVIGVGFDASPAARSALATATELALANNAALRVYAVAPKLPRVPGAESDGPARPSQAHPSQAQWLQEQLHAAVSELPSAARALPVYIRGFPAEELVKAARIGVDLLVLGSRAGGPVRRLLHHSVTSAVLQRTDCPLLIAPERVAAAT